MNQLLKTVVLNLIEWYYVPMHLAFLIDRVPLKRQYARHWLTLAFVLELAPMWYVVKHDVPMPWFIPSVYATEFYWFTLVHRAVHTLQTLDVLIRGPPRLDHKPPYPIIEIIADIYVKYDFANHLLCISWRLASISHPLVVAFAIAFWTSAFKFVGHELYLLWGTLDVCPCGEGIPATYRGKWGGKIGWTETNAFPEGHPELARYWRGNVGGLFEWFTACEKCITSEGKALLTNVPYGWTKPTTPDVVYQRGFEDIARQPIVPAIYIKQVGDKNE